MRMTLGKKIGFGFSIVVLAILIGAGVVMHQLDRAAKLSEMVMAVRQPTVAAALALESSVNRTQTAIRGLFLLGDERFRSDRAKAWVCVASDIESVLGLSSRWTLQQNRDRLAAIEPGLKALQSAQDQAEVLAGTPDNIPALKSLNVDGEPVAQRLASAMFSMIDEEKTLGADAERKALLAALADTRGTLGLALGSLRSFAQLGKAETKEEFTKLWAANAAAAARVEGLAKVLSTKQAAAWKAFTKDRAEFDAVAGKVIAARSGPDWNRGNALLAAVAPQVAMVRTTLAEMIASQRELAASDIAAADAAERSIRYAMGAVALISALVSVVTALLIARGVSRAVAPIVARTSAIASGNLTGAPLVATTSDELADITRAVNEMDLALRNVVSEVAVSSEEVSAAATQIAASSEEMSAGIKDQTRQLGEVNSAMAEMSASIGEVAAKSNHAAKTATDSGSTADAGAQIVRGTIEDMREIGQQSGASVASVESLGEKSKKIGEVVAVINEVAEQINLLALNAAIEAARAGEHGRGFAVVADEVRKLADRTQTATEEISSSITGIQSETTAVVGSIRSGTQRVEQGMGRAAQADTSLRSIIDSAGAVASLVNSIAAAATEQAATSEQINRTVGGVAAAARESEAASGQCAAAANQLSARAEKLRTLVGRFKLNESAHAAREPGRPHASAGPSRSPR